MRFSQLLDLRPGVTALIGAGGKTTLLRRLGEELAGERRVALCTTTKIYPIPGLPLARTAAELERLRRRHALVCVGTVLPESGKLTGPPVSMETLAAWFDYVLVEADGAAGRPLTAHAPHAPDIPPEAGRVIRVTGASGFGRPIREAAHRPERYARLAGVPETAPAAPETEAVVLTAEGLGDIVYINQVETPVARAAAAALAACLDRPAAAGSLWNGEGWRC